MSKILHDKIQRKSAHIAVIGLGYVGLPLAVNFAKAGFKVLGLDTNQSRVDKVNSATRYITDVSKADLSKVVRSSKLSASVDFNLLKDMDVILICVPTPLKRKYTPDITFITSAVRTIRKHFKRPSLIILESTTYPGTTEEVILPALEKTGRKSGKDFYLAFSPERIDPGNKKYVVTKIPKVVGGLTPKSSQLTKMLYKKIIDEVHVVSSPKAAEMTKLLENSFRIINIGWINEVAMMCHQMDIDVWEVIKAAETKPFGFMPFYPGLGVGGHCIPDDPLYLYWKARTHGFNSKYLKLSADTNSHMPEYAVNFLKKALRRRKKKFAHTKILIVGVTYKKDVKDLRKSPPLKLIEILQKENVEIAYHDPIIPFLEIGKIHMKSIELTGKNLKSFDCVILTTDHTALNYSFIKKEARIIFDLKNIYGKQKDKKIISF